MSHLNQLYPDYAEESKNLSKASVDRNIYKSKFEVLVWAGA